MLSWLPFPCDGWNYRREGFTDFQKGWFWELFYASLQSEWPGYLPMSADLWRVAGAHCSHCFNKDSAKVLAAFERAEVAGRGVIFFRPLVELLQEQSEKVRSHKARANFRISTIPLISTDFGSPSLSPDLDLKEKEKEKEIPPKLAERIEKERRDGLTRAKKMRLRDYIKHPLEAWEQPSTFAAAGD